MPIEERQPSPAPDEAPLGRWDDAHDAHSLGVLSVLPGSRVLDVGCGPGEVARRLVERECTVVGIEIDPAAAARADQVCERVVVGDVEAVDLDDALGGEKFDAVLCLDVLEHLKDPGAAVRRLAERLMPGGRLVASIPNVTHAAVRLQLLGGRFTPTEEGLLDRTHLHFFDRPAAEGLLEGAGLAIVERLRVRRGPTETEIPVDLDEHPPAAVEAILDDPDAETYQFVLIASEGAAGPGRVRSLAAVLQRRLEETQDALRDAGAYARQLESQLSAGAAHRSELEARAAEEAARRSGLEDRLAEVEGALRERLAELEVLHGELRHLQADLEIKDAYVLQLRAAALAGEESARLVDGLSQELGRVHAQVKIEADRRAEVEAAMAQLQARAGWRMVDRLEGRLRRHPVLHRLGAAGARLLAR